MKLKVEVMRRAVVALLAVTALASCGGGTQIEAFVPRRMIAFGDESNLINTDGTKYTVNAVVFDTTVTPAVPVPGPVLDCNSNLVWTQQLAYSYGMAFTGRCSSTVANANGVMLATVNARVADLKLQVDSFIAGDTFASNDLVTVMVGANDIIALYESQVDPTTNSAALIAAAQQAGTDVGAQVVRITDLAAKVIVSTIPSMGVSPYAYKEETDHPGGGRPALLAALSEQFNTRLRLKLEDVRDGGRAVGLVLADDLVGSIAKVPANYGITNISAAACFGAPLPTCNATTLDPATIDASGNKTYGGDWLWADDRHLGAAAQSRIGTLAVSRARSNPF
ncbi:MAG: SGNH/GDSL hydrolase family protein [Rhizobacter sp.]